MKQKWKKVTDKKTGSGWTGREDPAWFKILKPMLADTNSGLDNVFSDSAEISSYFKSFSEINESANVNEKSSAGERDDAEDFWWGHKRSLESRRTSERTWKICGERKQTKLKKGGC